MVNCLEGISIKAISCCVPHNHYSLTEYAPDLFNEKCQLAVWQRRQVFLP